MTQTQYGEIQIKPMQLHPVANITVGKHFIFPPTTAENLKLNELGFIANPAPTQAVRRILTRMSLPMILLVNWELTEPTRQPVILELYRGGTQVWSQLLDLPLIKTKEGSSYWQTLLQVEFLNRIEIYSGQTLQFRLQGIGLPGVFAVNLLAGAEPADITKLNLPLEGGGGSISYVEEAR